MFDLPLHLSVVLRYHFRNSIWAALVNLAIDCFIALLEFHRFPDRDDNRGHFSRTLTRMHVNFLFLLFKSRALSLALVKISFR
jgi:hypothetical protein